MAPHISQGDAWLAGALASSGSPVWGVIAGLAAFVVVGLVVLAVLGRSPRYLVVRRQWPGPWAARRERIKQAAAADVAAIEEDAKLVSPDAPGASDDEL